MENESSDFDKLHTAEELSIIAMHDKFVTSFKSKLDSTQLKEFPEIGFVMSDRLLFRLYGRVSDIIIDHNKFDENTITRLLALWKEHGIENGY